MSLLCLRSGVGGASGRVLASGCVQTLPQGLSDRRGQRAGTPGALQPTAVGGHARPVAPVAALAPPLTPPPRTILLSVISLLNEPNTFSPANVDASVMYRKWKESKGKDREYTDIIR